MSIKLAQTFYIDKTIVQNCEHVSLDCVNLYFKGIPLATKNRSGINNPGVTIYITPTLENGIPDLDHVIPTSTARCEYTEIIPSTDASIATKFKFPLPVVLVTNQTYAIVVAYDGNEQFDIWKCTEGELLVNTNTITSGANAKNCGNYFEYNYDATPYWKPLQNVDIKFDVRACAYTSNTSANSISDTYIIPSTPTEYIMYNRYHPKTINRTSLTVGEMMFLETAVIYGTVSVNNQSTTITSTNNINFSTLFSSPGATGQDVLSSNPIVSQDQYIVLRNGSTQSANVDVVKIHSIVSNTQLQLARLPVFTNNTATFSVTAVGQLDYSDVHYFTGRWFDYTANTFNYWTARKADLVRLVGSNSNSTVRFVNNTVESISIANGGIGYSNSDVITVYPVVSSNTSNSQNIAYIEEYANATANVITNGSGTITGISITNAGWGMTSNVAISITTSAGNSANLVVGTGTTLRGAHSNATIGDCVVTNMPVHRTYPNLRVLTNQHQNVSFIQHFPFYVYPGYEHIINQSNTAFNTEVHLFKNTDIQDATNNDSRILILPSYSKVQRKAANVTLSLANGSIGNTLVKSPSLIEIPVTSNNIYSMPSVACGKVYTYTYVINNDTTGETKGHGNAMCRHISEKVNFAQGRNAEDIKVYCDVYRPVGTNLNAYVRILAQDDQEAFDDKDWTLLEIQSNNATYTSSLTDETDIVEFTFGLTSAPASVNTISGYASTTISQANVIGIGTSWNTDLMVNDVVKIYSELFPQNYMISVVRAIANSSQITLDDQISDVDLTGSNFKVDLIGRPAVANTSPEIGNPFQAFTYEPNSYVCRYYDSAMSKHDTYNTFQVKLVLTSNNAAIVPKVWNTRAVGVSA